MSAIDTTRARLVERNAKAHHLTTRSERRCPLHPEHVITPDPTPVKWRCPLGHSVPAADIDLEVSTPAGPEPPARQGDHASRGSRWPG
ncbi:hypothetical protein Acsp03_71450 [Actinomadura sp. NBRC 104412]|uniref:hypothetical protein n=1 Tax=Actinomadura sp. NBRC 104412 TaxID=3032203 RepID=UPI0024A408CE|nr:hypothetical protein [Actinomadura sp. NBRC 104412]GLZ09679.1 hypothetical protein Acsp03_71450 [Actinomadura sp. NBRC 104412]